MDRSIGGVLDELAKSPESANTIVFFSADHGMPFPFSKATGRDYGSRTPALLHYPGMDAPKTFEQRTCNIDYMPTLLDLMGVNNLDALASAAPALPALTASIHSAGHRAPR
jgi:N-sulfoglucosamine sulfohydrolase